MLKLLKEIRILIISKIITYCEVQKLKKNLSSSFLKKIMTILNIIKIFSKLEFIVKKKTRYFIKIKIKMIMKFLMIIFR